MKSFLAQTTGIGLGTLTLRLVEPTFSWGSVIRGRLELSLTEPTEADALIVGLRARQRNIRVGRTRSGVQRVGSSNPMLFDFKQVVEGPGTYRTPAYDFALPVPEQPQVGAAGLPEELVDAGRVVQLLTGQVSIPPTWQVYAALKIPWRVNVKTDVDVQLRS
ncbi:MAG: hypothetical protein GY913_03505 [Proteobacteria bacterium]|nr:hypothetical protein [Pseudomonadota bacterium]MCP4915967.1 hypothetical protein [Pseudomonadota bacterium]